MQRKTASLDERLGRIEDAVSKAEDRILTAKQAAEYLDISIHHIWRLTSQGRLPHYKPGGKRLYFRQSELDEWIFSKKVHSNAEYARDAIQYSNRSSRNHKVREIGLRYRHVSIASISLGCAPETTGAGDSTVPTKIHKNAHTYRYSRGLYSPRESTAVLCFHG